VHCIAARLSKRHPDMARAYAKTLALLELNPGAVG